MTVIQMIMMMMTLIVFFQNGQCKVISLRDDDGGAMAGCESIGKITFQCQHSSSIRVLMLRCSYTKK